MARLWMASASAKRPLELIAALYVPHLLEEALTGMHDDPLIVSAYGALAGLDPRHAAYLVFQLTFAAALGLAVAYTRGGLARRAALAALALALIAEAHHLVRALVWVKYNPGLVTSLPMPLLGALVLWRVLVRGSRAPGSTAA
ncbi:MAG: HXXEE domain-containing protein [Myxococcales bacterium]|nr:MAG: HXXEE domain-containing protein [Myxococcales bacterium]